MVQNLSNHVGHTGEFLSSRMLEFASWGTAESGIRSFESTT
jgi:hypothetical protein